MSLSLLLVVVLPLALVAAAVVAAAVSVAKSSLRLSGDGVEVHNHGSAPERFALDDVVGFEPTPPVGWLTFVQPRTATLVLTDGRRVPVRRPVAAGVGRGVDALNEGLARLRSSRGD